jgi:membrane protein implicated in regulation of membrane protease activity
MKTILLVIFILFNISYVRAVVNYCCSGSNFNNQNGLAFAQCNAPYNTRCVTNTLNNNSTVVYSCGSDDTQGQSCDTDYCNCSDSVNKSVAGVQFFMAQMRRIMYPVMGVIFALIWVALAFIGGGPIAIVLLVAGLIDALFGIFLIFLPVTTYLGLYYVLVGALTIAIARYAYQRSGKHNSDHHRYAHSRRGIEFVIALTVIIFFITGGLTVISYNTPAGYFESINGFIGYCQPSMNLDSEDDGGLTTRCENWALFTAFSVFLLFLVQPIALIALFHIKSEKRAKASTQEVVHVHANQVKHPE